MIVLSATGISKSYGVDNILSNISFHINRGEHIGIVGDNGAGKTTLMNILTGEMGYDEGQIYISENTGIGYLKQSQNFNSERTVIEAVEEIFGHMAGMEEEMHKISDEIAEKSHQGMAESEEVKALLHRYDSIMEKYSRTGGYSYKSEINGVLSSMAFGEEYYQKKISTLSGGEKTRLALACLLLEKPDILFLDEPTNHLDIGTLKWLEQYLNSYKGTMVIISHDRYFLDQTVDRIFEVENHKLNIYQGGYSQYAVEKHKRREEELKAYEHQQEEISRQEEMIRRFKQHGTEKLAKRAASREKHLSKLERLERPEALRSNMKIRFKQDFSSGNDVISAENLSKSFGFGERKRQLFENVNFDIKRGEKICIVGANGVGKTSLLKMIMEELKPDMGRLKIGHNVELGYYDQEQQNLTGSNTVFEEMKNAYRLYNDKEMRNLLGRFLFRGESVFLEVGSLSGGEKARLSLLKLMLSGANVLILDEPTNHLDISSKEVFEEALMDYEGTVIAVSHDRYFLNRIPDRIFELNSDGMMCYQGSYDYYVEKKEELGSGKKYLEEMSFKASKDEKNRDESSANQQMSSEEFRRAQKEQDAKARKRKRETERLETEISNLESEISALEAEMCKEEIFKDHMVLAEYHEKTEALKAKLSQTYEEWMLINDPEE